MYNTLRGTHNYQSNYYSILLITSEVIIIAQ